MKIQETLEKGICKKENCKNRRRPRYAYCRSHIGFRETLYVIKKIKN